MKTFKQFVKEQLNINRFKAHLRFEHPELSREKNKKIYSNLMKKLDKRK